VFPQAADSIAQVWGAEDMSAFRDSGGLEEAVSAAAAAHL
jgi:hypothetical protein